MKAFFEKKVEVSLPAVVLVVLVIVALTASLFVGVRTEPKMPGFVVLLGAAGMFDVELNQDWEIVYLEFGAVRYWTCTQPSDPAFADWTVHAAYTGWFMDCIAALDIYR